eukprot:CAMPEP_0180811678 /NCGR_PEP_ID=MMETSP1038_2-20121128/65567_1 /TAXON_ID=632150 /ORGANISM="Azadinium spinosum, Strain 3D9" /LENGTH=40 /DNA_ID= /DNA_START= /DNA_END= /DNA_ORIENTATION=
MTACCAESRSFLIMPSVCATAILVAASDSSTPPGEGKRST